MTTTLRLPGITNNYASVPDSVALSITGDIDIRVKLSLDDWTGASVPYLISKRSGSTDRSYSFYVTNTGLLRLQISSDGSAISEIASTSDPNFSPGEIAWVRVTRKQSDGLTKFFTGTDGSSWSQLGTDRTLSSGAAIFNSGSDLGIGAQGSGGSPTKGNFYRAQVRNNILDDGSGIVFDANFETITKTGTRTPTTFVESSSNAVTVTVNGSAWDWFSEDTKPLLLNTGFEHGVDPTTGLAVSSSRLSTLGQMAIFSAVSGSPTVISGAARSGGYGLRCSATAGQCRASMLYSGTSSGVGVFRLYLRFNSSMPPDQTTLFSASCSGGGPEVFVRYDTATSSLELFGTSLSSFGNIAMTTGVWYRVEFMFTTEAPNLVASWSIDGIVQATGLTGVGTTLSIPDQLRFGWTSTTTASVDFDDVAVSGDPDAYPIGPGYGGVVRPSSLTLASSGVFVQDASATAITTGDWARIDDDPISETTSYIRQTTGSSDLVNGHPVVGFTNTNIDSINGVRALAAYSAASSLTMASRIWLTTNDADTYLHGNSTTQPSIASTSTVYMANQVINGWVEWTDNLLDTLVLRFGTGAGTDVSPIPNYNNFILEVDYHDPRGRVKTYDDISKYTKVFPGAIISPVKFFNGTTWDAPI